MVMVLVGDDPASESYLARKAQDCAEVGMRADVLRLSADISPGALLDQIAWLNDDPEVDGFFVQFPLPSGHDPAEVSAAIAPTKDIDGLGPASLSRLVVGLPGLRPCTPAGILALLTHYEIPLAGRHVVVLGRGTLVGRPLSLLLSAKGVDANVTVLHSRSGNIEPVCRSADILISATGSPGLVRPEMIRPGAAVIGAGISYSAAGEMLSDLSGGLEARAGFLTPSPRAIGALTRIMLLENLMKAAETR